MITERGAEVFLPLLKVMKADLLKHIIYEPQFKSAYKTAPQGLLLVLSEEC